MVYSFASRVSLSANWERKNPQPCWYRMKVPQFIHNKCVVCYQSRQDCELQFKGEFTVDAFHKSPFPVLDSDNFNPMFGYYPITIPEHHWFHQWNEFGNLKFIYYEEQQDTGVSPPSEEERFFFCERLVRKWTEISPSFISAIEETELLQAVSLLWGDSPYIEQRLKDRAAYQRQFYYRECICVSVTDPELPPYTGDDWGIPRASLVQPEGLCTGQPPAKRPRSAEDGASPFISPHASPVSLEKIEEMPSLPQEDMDF